MSDNPNDSEELASLGINIDDASALAAIDQLQSATEDYGASIQQAFAAGKTAAEAYADFFSQITSQTEQQTQAQQSYNDQLTETSSKLQEINDLNELRANLGIGGQYTGSYDELRGNLFNPPDDIGGGDDGSGGGGGSFNPRGLSRGFGAAAGLARQAGAPELGGGLQVSGEILRVSTALQNMPDIFDKLNTAIEATPGLLAPLVDGFTAMGVEMAGLAALAAPVIAVGVAIAGVVAVLKLLQEQSDASAASLGLQSKNEDDKNKISTENSDKGIVDLKAKQQEVIDNNKKIADLQNDQVTYLADKIKSFEGSNITDAEAQRIARQQVTTGTFTSNRSDITDISDVISQATNAAGYKDTQTKISGYQTQSAADTQLLGDSLKDLSNGSNAAAEAALKQQQADKGLIDATTEATKESQERATLDKLTTDQAQGRLAVLKDEQKQLNDNAATLAKADQGNKDVQKAVEANNDALKDNAFQQQYLTDTVLKANSALDDWTQHETDIKDAADEANKVETQRVALIKQLTDAETAYATQVADAKAKETNAEQQYILGMDADVQARQDISTKESRQEAQTKQAMADADADIRTKLQDNLAQANTGLARQLEDDTTKYNNDRAKAVRDEQDTENEDLESHLQKLADIQNQQHNSDQQALLDRNFLQLAKNKESGDQQVSQENERYNNQIDDLREHLANSQRDQQIAYQQEEQQQTLAEERKRDDLELAAQQAWTAQQTSEERKLATQRTAEQQQLDDLTTTEQRKLQVLRQGLQDELQLLQTQEQQRLAIIQQSITDLGPTGQTPTGSNSGGRITPRAFAGGGDFSAGDPFTFNEPGSSGFESVNIGSTSFGSNTAALVIPFGAGNVNPGKGGGQPIYLQPNFYITGNNNAEQVANYAIGKMQDMLEGVIKP